MPSDKNELLLLSLNFNRTLDEPQVQRMKITKTHRGLKIKPQTIKQLQSWRFHLLWLPRISPTPNLGTNIVYELHDYLASVNDQQAGNVSSWGPLKAQKAQSFSNMLSTFLMKNSHKRVETPKGFVLEGMGSLVFEPLPHFFPL